MARNSKFSSRYGILFAGDLATEAELFMCLDKIVAHIEAIKLGNALLYQTGVQLVQEVKTRYGLPVIVDLKLTDVSHIARRVVESFICRGADAIILAGVCGREVIGEAVRVASEDCEIWTFTEFTNDSGLIDPSLADLSVRIAVGAGATGFQVPGTRPHRIEEVRAEVGQYATIIACGIGAQGGRFGSAVVAGANLEILGRAIYADPDPAGAAEVAKEMVVRAEVAHNKRDSACKAEIA